VENLETFRKDFDVLTTVDPEWMTPKAPNLASEHDVVLRLLSACRYGRHQLADPDAHFTEESDQKAVSCLPTSAHNTISASA
jgi:hypothetical protein